MTTTLLLPDLLAREVATVEGESHHHLFRVKRHQAGDELRVVDGAGNARVARIESIGKREARIALGAAAPANEPATRVELFVAVPKPERAAWLVEKATELGVRSIRFVRADRSARELSASQLERLRRIAGSALEQCERSWLPRVEEAGALATALDRATEAGGFLVALDGGGEPALPEAGERPIALFVGPEGGWSPAERALLGARAQRIWALGPTILRVETAAVVATGIALTTSACIRAAP